ncbi:MAG TPA: FAD-dependent oxidoreductase, partial [Nitrososphaerales archaeon]|nr:FAD-dependent oxidoreductase [Nitrososphaerales archaeon]
MVTVCVLGGGTAGTEAAVEAARCGAEVTLLERSSHPPLPRTLWSRMLDGEVTQPRRSHLLSTLRVEVLFGFAARSLGPDHRVYGSESSARFDSVVIATGSRSKAVLFAGSNKPGVNILADATDYLELAARQDSIEKLVVTGSGLPVFEVAERLNR